VPVGGDEIGRVLSLSRGFTSGCWAFVLRHTPNRVYGYKLRIYVTDINQGLGQGVMCTFDEHWVGSTLATGFNR
jgi:hypothetical protein